MGESSVGLTVAYISRLRRTTEECDGALQLQGKLYASISATPVAPFVPLMIAV